jgi:hypothetical protein
MLVEPAGTINTGDAGGEMTAYAKLVFPSGHAERSAL